ncbi:unnamed protein product [Eruca vesicaria subsp. sativa]|uniref:Uncharacterized protein n=1 Tax=Eruca vesicaria subsp. sativa TaxID=29727 RepID=A0ABC8L9G3_ERUVS|nr:unnamed protein product [Eruca vesicaria subsp. sativa]
MAQSGPLDNRRRPRPPELNLPDMQQRRIPTSVASAGFVMPSTSGSSGHSMPPGAVGSSTRDHPPVNNYNHVTEQALLRSAAREYQPHLHPKKVNGALCPTASTATTAPSRRFLLDQEFLKRATTSKGGIYGIGSVQFRDYEPRQSVPASLKRSLDMDLRVSGIETNAEHVQATVELLKTDMATLKEDFLAFKTEMKQEMAATRSSLNVILQALGALGAASPPVNQPDNASTP